MVGTSAAHASVDNVVARLERLPTSWWHVKTRIIVGVATFFDAFDALAIATVLPVIVPLWKLSPPQIGFLISAGFLGQLLGALLFGWVAERYGRMAAMVWSIALFAVMSLVCAFAWDYNSLLVFRAIQGIGSGRRGAGRRRLHQRAGQGQGPRPLRAAVRAGVSDRPRQRQPGRPVGGADVRLAMDVRDRRAAGVPRAGVALAAAGIAALAGGARPHRRGRSRDGADRARNREGHRQAAATAAAGGHDVGQAGVARRPVRPALSAAHAGGLGDLVLRLFRQLWALDLAADRLPHRVPAPARGVAALRPDHPGGRPHRHADLRPGDRPCGTAALVRGVVRGRHGRAGGAGDVSHAHRRSRCSSA